MTVMTNNFTLIGKIDPFWNIDDFKHLPMITDTLKAGSTSVTMYTDAGHNLENMQVSFYHERDPSSDLVIKIQENFDFLDHLGVAVNLLKPGSYLPWHTDGFDRYREVFGINDVNQIYRAIIMTQPAQPGQYVHIDQHVYHDWQAGDWYAWLGKTWHATYNLSTQDRYIIQITGALR